MFPEWEIDRNSLIVYGAVRFTLVALIDCEFHLFTPFLFLPFQVSAQNAVAPCL